MQTSLFRKRASLKLVVLTLFVALLSGCVKDSPFPPVANEESADVAYSWYKLMIKIGLNTAPPPVVLQNNRNLAFVGVGLYEAVRPGIRNAVSLSSRLYQMPTMPMAGAEKYSWSVSANAALASLFRHLTTGLTAANQASMDSFENVYNDKLASHLPEDVFSRSQAFGRAIATAIYNWSTTDNYNLSAVGYTFPVLPGAWEPTPPALAQPLGPFIPNSRPLLQSSLTSALPPPPPPYSEDPSSTFYKAVKEVYDIGKALTPEQKKIASWWADAGGPAVGFAGGGHALSIVTSVLESHKAKLGQAAEIYAKTGITMKDGIYRTWRCKYHYFLLRPITYIRKVIDPTWSSFLPTPPYPEYSSGLVGIYAPLIQVLKREYGDGPISDNSYAFRGDAPRQFPSFTKLVEEAAVSRIYAGIHYRFTQNISVDVGQQFGDEVANIKLVSSGYGDKDN